MSTCAHYREALSARLDGELRPLEQDALDRHLDTCRTCPVHADELSRLHRSSRLSPAEAVPDLTRQILTAHRQRTTEVPAADWRRWAIAVLGLTIGILAVPSLLAGDGDAPIHLSRELAAWEVALSASLLVVAWQPWRAAGIFPLAGVVVAILGVTAVADAAAGDVAPAAEAHHVLQLAAVALLYALTRAAPAGRPTAATATI